MPSVAYVIFMLLNKAESLIDLLSGKASVLGKFNIRLKPKLGFTTLPLNMHMHSRLFPRKEVKPETSLTENGWTHGQNDTR